MEVFSDQSCGNALFEDEVTANLVVGDEGFNSNSCFSSWFRSTRAVMLAGLRVCFGRLFVDSVDGLPTLQLCT